MSLTISSPPVVVDASVAVDFLAEPDDDLDLRWRRWTDEGRLLIAPPYLWAEVANGLLRGRRLAAPVVTGMLDDFEASGISTADRGAAGVRASVELAAEHGLTVYDASYLWLAIDIDGELATRDKALIRAARAEGVALALD